MPVSEDGPRSGGSHTTQTALGRRGACAIWHEYGRRSTVEPTATPPRPNGRRSQVLQDAVVKSIDKNVRRDMNPPYIGPLPGAKLTFRESMRQERPSEQQWPHRPYAELMQADILPHEQANL